MQQIKDISILLTIPNKKSPHNNYQSMVDIIKIKMFELTKYEIKFFIQILPEDQDELLICAYIIRC